MPGGVPVRFTDSKCVSQPNRIGWCDVDGTITIAPCRPEYHHAYDYGCPCDGFHSDWYGLKAFIDLMEPTRNEEIRLPPKNMLLHQPLHVTKQIRMRGAASSGAGPGMYGTIINVPPGQHGIVSS